MARHSAVNPAPTGPISAAARSASGWRQTSEDHLRRRPALQVAEGGEPGRGHVDVHHPHRVALLPIRRGQNRPQARPPARLHHAGARQPRLHPRGQPQEAAGIGEAVQVARGTGRIGDGVHARKIAPFTGSSSHPGKPYCAGQQRGFQHAVRHRLHRPPGQPGPAPGNPPGTPRLPHDLRRPRHARRPAAGHRRPPLRQPAADPGRGPRGGGGLRAADPYAKAGLFESTVIRAFRTVLRDGEVVA